MSKLFRRRRSVSLPSGSDLNRRREQIPDDIVDRCPACNRLLLQTQITEEFCCSHCGHHMVFPPRERIAWLVDSGTFEEQGQDLTLDPMHDFPHYREKHEHLQEETGLDEAIITGFGEIGGISVALGVMANDFMMGSMGTLVGEKLTRLFDAATKRNWPVVLYIASGGARMQESILSLMQMAKVSQAVERHSQAGLFYCSVLTHPTTGGVTASFAMQADIILAEPHATIGFAGRRVIEQTINSRLPDDFQQAESVLNNGFIDHIVPRSQQIPYLKWLLKVHQVDKEGSDE